ncbi:hypothetical protein pphageT12_17 [Pseudomonas phage pphageT12]|uniref:Uncharacterized protein n=1 Tax=Pseudomonas phage phiB1_1 TaxID=2755402 RepID=A0A7D7F1A6_9CAUD|nr:hypothetical protein phiB1_1_11 [Pseudomonas phage phiB1_1]UAW53650.1 hypothetical protein pphageB21_17 [Pseudomonas phage pphageB21]UAW53709.1 hypothetical protein pphageT21_17 [Pseudomonas phage pphageT21]UAW53768.1 hypothetical protein pphageT12_17 [Pseudomonas phage pphageT12]UAW53829.1 hypothetical protein pphageBV72_17 [Pseudomonas phage pphageBV72]
MSKNKPNDVRVSRELFRSALGAVEYLALRGDDIGTSNVPVADALRALLAQPADQQDEPVAWLITLIEDGSTYCITENKPRADRLTADSDYVTTPLYRHAQPSTAKVVLPEPNIKSRQAERWPVLKSKTYNP